jgi:hypothetical protein
MKLNLYIGTLLVITCFSLNSYGQQKEGQKQQQRNFYRKTLQVDSVKAEQIAEAQDTYKESLKAVMTDTTLNEGAKRQKIKILMENKNQKLKRLLNVEQQQKLIPTTERTVPKATETNN